MGGWIHMESAFDGYGQGVRRGTVLSGRRITCSLAGRDASVSRLMSVKQQYDTYTPNESMSTPTAPWSIPHAYFVPTFCRCRAIRSLLFLEKLY